MAVPQLKQLLERYGKQGFVLIGIHTTKGGEKMGRFVEKHTLKWPVAVDIDDKSVEALGNNSGKPDYYLIDRKGILRFADLEESELERASKALVEEKP